MPMNSCVWRQYFAASPVGATISSRTHCRHVGAKYWVGGGNISRRALKKTLQGGGEGNRVRLGKQFAGPSGGEGIAGLVGIDL